jgi:hypothetical protein
MNKHIDSIVCVLLLSFMLLLPFVSCSKDSPSETQPPPEKTRQEIVWLDETIQLTPDNFCFSSNFFRYGDTLDMDISLLVGNEIGSMFVADEENYNSWESNQMYSVIFSQDNSQGGNFLVRIPTEDTYYLVIQNSVDPNSIRVEVVVIIIRWVYE